MNLIITTSSFSMLTLININADSMIRSPPVVFVGGSVAFGPLATCCLVFGFSAVALMVGAFDALSLAPVFDAFDTFSWFPLSALVTCVHLALVVIVCLLIYVAIIGAVTHLEGQMFPAGDDSDDSGPPAWLVFGKNALNALFAFGQVVFCLVAVVPVTVISLWLAFYAWLDTAPSRPRPRPQKKTKPMDWHPSEVWASPKDKEYPSPPRAPKPFARVLPPQPRVVSRPSPRPAPASKPKPFVPKLPSQPPVLSRPARSSCRCYNHDDAGLHFGGWMDPENFGTPPTSDPEESARTWVRLVESVRKPVEPWHMGGRSTCWDNWNPEPQPAPASMPSFPSAAPPPVWSGPYEQPPSLLPPQEPAPLPAPAPTYEPAYVPAYVPASLPLPAPEPVLSAPAPSAALAPYDQSSLAAPSG
ncbi:hypothetical protein JX266_009001 [Neoarthrinium moseri]|nr:hypothetical protein JX266_009001 [Neoarthrinium moseri]